MQRAGSCTSSLRRILRLQNRVKRPCIILLSGGVAMIPYHFYYQLVVLGLLWLCVMLHPVLRVKAMPPCGPQLLPPSVISGSERLRPSGAHATQDWTPDL